jgi:hypothetical protein
MLPTIESERMTSIGATLKPGYYIVSGGKNIDNLPLSFISPL